MPRQLRKRTSDTINIILDGIIDPQLITYKITQGERIDTKHDRLVQLTQPVDHSLTSCSNCSSTIEVNIFISSLSTSSNSQSTESDDRLETQFVEEFRDDSSSSDTVYPIKNLQIKIEPIVIPDVAPTDAPPDDVSPTDVSKTTKRTRKRKITVKEEATTDDDASKGKQKKRSRVSESNGTVDIPGHQILRTKSEKILTTVEEFNTFKEQQMLKPKRYPYYEIMTMGDGTCLYFLQSGRRTTFLMTNFDLRPLTCDICEQSFTEPYFLLKHRRNHFYQEGIMKCWACGEENFESKEQIYRHSDTCKEKSNLQKNTCKHCGRQFDNVGAWRRHEVSHFEHLTMDCMRRKICEICSVECKSAAALRDHKRKEHKIDLYVCEHCSKTFAFRQLLRDHLFCQHFPRLAKFPCPICHKPFNQTETLKKHTSQKHSSEMFTCEICHKTIKATSRTHHMERHKSVSEKKKFFCDVCNKLFTSKLSMQNHRVSIHVDPKDWPYQCNECGQRLPHKGRLLIHKQSHAPSHNCEVCNKAFRSRQNLQTHMNLHTGKSPYACKLCVKTFNDRSALHSHLKTHEAAMGVKLTLTPEERRLQKLGILSESVTHDN